MLTHRRKSMLLYWSTRYFLIIIVTMTIMISIILYVVQANAVYNQERRMEQFVREAGSSALQDGGYLIQTQAELKNSLLVQSSQIGLNNQPHLFILDRQGQIIEQIPSDPFIEPSLLNAYLPIILTGRSQVITFDTLPDRPTYVVAGSSFTEASEARGYILYMEPKVNLLADILQFKIQRLLTFLSFLFCGWSIVYFMTKHLLQPIQDVRVATAQMMEGNYNISLNKDYKEKEIYELIQTMKEMAQRLNRLETLRTQLMAGVTHELKTPLSSISGLIQAVRDGVVSKEEANRFLDHSLHQTVRLQKMVEDLLNFSHFASKKIPTKQQTFDLEELIKSVVERWKTVHTQKNVKIYLEIAPTYHNWQLNSDPYRIEQIMINLFDNAHDAIVEEGVITVHLTATSSDYNIYVKDTGCGIPTDEQSFIFESFYRGKEKKKNNYGLGLGLSLSKRIAHTLGGDLILAETSPSGSTFLLSIPTQPS